MSDTINEDYVNNLCIELYDEWFSNKKLWFSKLYEYDLYLINKYYKHSEDFISFIINYNYSEVSNKKILIGLILLLDQIPRHYNRIANKINIQYYSYLAIKFSNIVITNNDVYNLTIMDYCFVYLPYRHLNAYDKIHELLDFFINKYESCQDDDKHICKNYIHTTINKIYKNISKKFIEEQINDNNILNVKNNNIDFNRYKDILYYNPIDNYLPFKSDDLAKYFIKELNNLDNIEYFKYIIVSISGGVDSNISLYILKNICNSLNKTLIAVHINYNNRYTSYKELLFVKDFCRSLNIKLYYRTITEISRNNCHNNGLRNLYETITKNIRFDFYKQIIDLYFNNAVIVLGHNKDDCFENIITNITNKKNYENLSGMNKISYIDNINFWRPLLDIDKKDIINYAITNNIPYLEDSTPKWSNRGKIRDIVKPCLENFNKNIVSSIFELKNNMSNLSNIIDIYVIPCIYDRFKIENIENNIIIIGFFNKNELLCDINVWTKLFTMDKFYNVFYKNNKGISYKSINEFLLSMTRFIINFEKININIIKKQILRNDIVINYYKTKDNLLCLKFITS